MTWKPILIVRFWGGSLSTMRLMMRRIIAERLTGLLLSNIF